MMPYQTTFFIQLKVAFKKICTRKKRFQIRNSKIRNLHTNTHHPQSVSIHTSCIHGIDIYTWHTYLALQLLHLDINIPNIFSCPRNNLFKVQSLLHQLIQLKQHEPIEIFLVCHILLKALHHPQFLFLFLFLKKDILKVETKKKITFCKAFCTPNFCVEMNESSKTRMAMSTSSWITFDLKCILAWASDILIIDSMCLTAIGTPCPCYTLH